MLNFYVVAVIITLYKKCASLKITQVSTNFTPWVSHKLMLLKWLFAR